MNKYQVDNIQYTSRIQTVQNIDNPKSLFYLRYKGTGTRKTVNTKWVKLVLSTARKEPWIGDQWQTVKNICTFQIQ